MEAGVEVGQDLLPGDLPLLHLVQLLLHMGRKGDVDDILEPVHHQAGDHLAQGRGPEALFLLQHIIPVLDGGNNAGVGGGAADALFLHGPDQRGLGIAGRGLGKVLLGPGGGAPQRLALAELRQRRLNLLLLVVLSLLIEGGEAGEFQALVIGPEDVLAALGLDGHAVIEGHGHLRGGEPLPDQLIEAELVAGEIRFDPLGVQGHIAGPDGFVGILGGGLGLVAVGLAVVVVAAPAAENVILCRGQGLLGEALGVGTHIGNETHGADAGDLHALIELLGQGHGLLGRHAQLPGGLLLEGGGDKGRRGRPLFLGALDAENPELPALQGGGDGLGLGLAVKLPLLGVPVEPGRKAAGLLHPVQVHVDGPVLLGDKGPDLVLPVHHQPCGHRLDPARREAPAHLFPQQRRELIAHDPVENPPGLLGVHQVLVDGPGLLDGLGHDALGDFIEGDPVDLVVGNVQQGLEVPGNGLALPVRVGCQIYLIALFREGFQILDDVFLALDRLVDRREIVLQIHAHRALGQIAEVAHTGLDLVAAAQVFADRLGLGRRLDDHQIGLCLGHDAAPYELTYILRRRPE